MLYVKAKDTSHLNGIVERHGFVPLIEKQWNNWREKGNEVFSDQANGIVCLYEDEGDFFVIHSFAFLAENTFKPLKLNKNQRRYLHEEGVKQKEFDAELSV